MYEIQQREIQHNRETGSTSGKSDPGKMPVYYGTWELIKCVLGCASQHEKRQASSIPCRNIALPVGLKEVLVNFLSFTNLHWIPGNIKKCPNITSRHRIELTFSTAFPNNISELF